MNVWGEQCDLMEVVFDRLMVVVGLIWWNLSKANSETNFKWLNVVPGSSPFKQSGQGICFEEWEEKEPLSLSYFFARFGREFETWSCGACFAVGCREFRVVSSGLWNCFCEICTGLRNETKTSPKNLLITITMSVSISVACSCLGTGTGGKGWM